MRRSVVAVLCAGIALTACVSTEMKSLVGRDITEAQIRYGPPTNVIAMPDGRRAFQFPLGGGARVVPGTQTINPNVYGGVTATGTPAMVVEAPPCTLTFITRPNGDGWLIEETRTPRQLVC